MPINERPLSPHLQIYKLELPMVLSGLHRITGMALSVGTILLVGWIASAAQSVETYNSLSNFLGGYFGQFLLFGWSFSLIYHSVSGVRHLLFDTGRLLEVDQIKNSSIIVIALSIVLTLLAWVMAGGYYPGGGL